MDRQDIDALLIGALYGELTPADEARLAAHLESHPTDKGALDDLKSARAAVRESRIFELQLEPPQALSALLLQEAHRRAPKRAAVQGDDKESWFYRFTRVFLAHPAMAAAAMLVLVVGVAGTLYVRNGDAGFAEKQAAAPTQPAATETVPAQDLAKNEAPAVEDEPADRGAAEGAAGAPGSGYAVQFDDTFARPEPRADKLAESRERAERQGAKQKRQAVAEKSSSIVVTTPRRQPKDLDEPRARSTGKKGVAKRDFEYGLDSQPATGGASNGVVGGVAPNTATAPRAPAPARSAPPPPPPSAVASAPTATPKPSPTKEAAKPADEKADSAGAKDRTLIAWARAEHNRTVGFASKGDCRAAAKVAVAVQSRAPDYYAQNMATDRLLKKCQVYIAQERDAEAERTGKARSKRVTTDEPAQTK